MDKNKLVFEYINGIIPLTMQIVPSGTEVGDWKVPDEWVIRDGWVKFNGEKILDYKDNPLSVVVGSLPINKKCDLAEFKRHLHVSDEKPEAFAYEYKFYDKDWGFSLPKNKVMQHVIQKCEGGTCTEELRDIDPTIGQVMIEGSENAPIFKEILPEGEYEVFIDSEYRPGAMKIGIHEIPGKSKKEILLFAHLDHPYQANDNLSAVACLIDLVKDLKDKYEHTIKIIFCPETIGSIAYAELNPISQVEFVISVDSIGNDNTLLIQKSFDKYHRINACVHLATAGQGIDYRKGDFRLLAGADEYYFNDPNLGIPGLFLSRIPFAEYHTSADTPDKISYEKIQEVQKVILKTIEFYEQDFIPKREFKGCLMRSKYGEQTPYKNLNRDLDYLMYDIDGKRYLSHLILPLGMGFEYAYKLMLKLEGYGKISRCAHACEKPVKKVTRKKQKRVQRKANVPVESGEVPPTI